MIVKYLQWVQNGAASFVLWKYTTKRYVLSLGWLAVIKRVGFNLAKMMYKSINSEIWPRYLNTEETKQTFLRL